MAFVGESDSGKSVTALAEPMAVACQAVGRNLVMDAVEAAGTRAEACRIARPGGLIVHAGLLPGPNGLDIRRLTLHEITGACCCMPHEFRTVVGLLAAGRFGPLGWFEVRPLAEGARAVADIGAGRTSAAKLVLVP